MFPRILIAAFLSPLALGAQVPSDAAPRSIAAYPVQRPIIIDGRLDEADWHNAEPATGFTQSEPATGSVATEATEVRVLFDSQSYGVFGRYSVSADGQRFVVVYEESQPSSTLTFVSNWTAELKKK